MDRINSHKVFLGSNHKKYYSDYNYNPVSTKIKSGTLMKNFKLSKSNPKIKINSTSHSNLIPDILNTDKCQMMEFEKYKKNNEGLMSEYRFESEPSLLTKFGNFAAEEQMKNIKSFLTNNNNSKINSKFNHSKVSEDTKINISVPTEEYKSILDAVLVLKNNKQIHDNLMKNFICRQKNKFLETYIEINNSHEKSNSNKVKVTTIMPKSNNFSSIFSNQEKCIILFVH